MLPFGKKLRTNNFVIEKISKSLSKEEMKMLRSETSDTFPEICKLPRVSVPYIRISTISRSWSIDIACTLKYFQLIDGISVVDDGEKLDFENEDDKGSLEQLVVLFYSLTTIVGDEDYYNDVRTSIFGFIDRLSQQEVSKEDDKEILEQMEVEHTSGENIINMAEHIKQMNDGKVD